MRLQFFYFLKTHRSWKKEFYVAPPTLASYFLQIVQFFIAVSPTRLFFYEASLKKHQSK